MSSIQKVYTLLETWLSKPQSNMALQEVSPETVADALTLLMKMQLRHRDPKGPGLVIELAEHLAEKGLAPMSGPLMCRKVAMDAAELLGEAGIVASLWTLPGLGPHEQRAQLWRDRLAKQCTLKDGYATPQLTWRPDYTFFSRLEAFYANTSFETAGVGDQGVHTSIRSDAVRYLTGYESDLRHMLPELAALIQDRSFLVEHLGEAGMIPPHRAMLARYPAPSEGYKQHIDNPGGDKDNGRSRTLVFYLNPPEHACVGGAMRLATSKGSVLIKPQAGNLAVLDARTIPHQVDPLKVGPPRWALSFWFNEGISMPNRSPQLSLTDLLIPRERPPLQTDRVLYHDLTTNQIHSVIRKTRDLKVGIVCTVYRAGNRLHDWCRHHFNIGFTHLFLVFDHLSEPEERSTAEALERPFDNLTIIDGEQLMAANWPLASEDPSLRHFARQGSTLAAVCARQTLNATEILHRAKNKLDWLLHIDADERFQLCGSGRGGARLQDHFTTVEEAGYHIIRYANHERLSGEHPFYKINPDLAQAKLGVQGWAMLQSKLSRIDRPYFHGYRNGKAAVRLEAAQSAAGVHGWKLKVEATPPPFLAGPIILHDRLINPTDFAAKYRRLPAVETQRLFEPSGMETAAMSLIAKDGEAADLASLCERFTNFSQEEIELMEAASLIYRKGSD